MEKLFAQLLTILIYAPIPITILWLLIGAAFSKPNRPSAQPPSRPNQDDRYNSSQS